MLASVLGIATRELVRGQVELELPVSTDFGDKRVGLVLMHPLHCFVSRAVTVYHPAIRRRDGLAMRQLRASTWILAAFLDELANIDVRETGRWLVALGHTLAKHEWVRQIDVAMDLDLDPLEILLSFSEDQRLDTMFRNSQIAGWIAKVRRIRTVFAKKHVRAV